MAAGPRIVTQEGRRLRHTVGQLTLRRLVQEQSATQVMELTVVLSVHIEQLLPEGSDCQHLLESQPLLDFVERDTARESGTRSGRMFSTALMFSCGALSGQSKFPSGVKNLLAGPLRLSSEGQTDRDKNPYLVEYQEMLTRSSS